MKKKGKKAGDKTDKKKDAPAGKNEVKEEPKSAEAAKAEGKEDETALTAEPEAVDDAAETEPLADHESRAEDEDEQAAAAPDTPSRPPHGRQPSLSIQSKMRSTSFRQASGGMPVSPSMVGGSGSGTLAPLSPDGYAMGEIFR